MKLWLLTAGAGPGTLPKQWQTYDVATGLVVRAKNEQAAREMAAKECGDEGSAAWLDSSLSDCEILTPSGESEIILRDFHAG